MDGGDSGESASGGRAWRYVVAFFGLVALTASELYVIQLPVERAARVTALAGLAILKAAIVLSLFMELRGAGRPLRRIALLPIFLGPAIAVVFMLEAAYQAARR